MGNTCVTTNGRQVTNHPDCQDPQYAEQRIWWAAAFNIVFFLIWRILLGSGELASGKTKIFFSGAGALVAVLFVSVV